MNQTLPPTSAHAPSSQRKRRSLPSHDTNQSTTHNKSELDLQAVNLQLEAYQNNDDDDSFDASSLIPNSSDSSNVPSSTANHPSEHVSALHTFLHSNQDHPRHLHQLNNLIPSPATTASNPTGPKGPHQINQAISDSLASSSISADDQSGLQSWRMHISNKGIPHTLMEETSEEIRQSEISAINNGSPDLSTQDEVFSDDDDSTIYAHQNSERYSNDTLRFAPTGKHFNDPRVISSNNGHQNPPGPAQTPSAQSAPTVFNINSSSNCAPTRHNHLHAMAESIGFHDSSRSQAYPSSAANPTHSNHFKMHASPINDTLSTFASSLRSASSFSQETPPTTPLRGGSDSDDASNFLGKKEMYAQQHQAAIATNTHSYRDLSQASSRPSAAPWVSSLVKTPSRLQFSFVPASHSNANSPEDTQNDSPTGAHQQSFNNATAYYTSTKLQQSVPSGSFCFDKFADSTHISSLNVIKQPKPVATPQYIKNKREFEQTFLQSPRLYHDKSGKRETSTQGEARIFYQSHQTNSILNGMNGQSCSHILDQSFPHHAPNQSFGFEFSDPVGIKDWSIHHSPSTGTRAFGEKTETNSCELPEINHETPNKTYVPLPVDIEAEHAKNAQQPSGGNSNPSSTKNCSLFDPQLSQMDPLPRFSPFRVPQLKQIHLNTKSPIQSTLGCEESPLAVRTKKHNTKAGKENILAQSILQSRLSTGHLPSDRIHCSPTKLPPSPMADVSVYMTPDASLVEDEEQQLQAEAPKENLVLDQHQPTHTSKDYQVHPLLNQIQDHLSSSCEIDLHDRYRILALLAENLKQDLSIKNQVIQVLQTDQEKAHKDRDTAEQKMAEMAEKLKHAAMEQKSKRDQQVHKIASIVQSLTSEIEAVMSKCELSCSEDSAQLSLQEVHQFQTHLKSSKVAMENFQTVLDEVQSPNGLDLRNSQQTKKTDVLEAELATSESVHRYQPQVINSETSRKNNSAAHEWEVSRLKLEIESLSNKLSVTTLHDEDVEQLKYNVRMLEEEAKIKMESMSQLRSKSHDLQQELESTAKALEIAKGSQSEALREVEKLRKELKTVNDTHFSKQQAHLERLIENQDQFNVDQTELMLKLKNSNQHIDELKVELEKARSKTCQDCEAKDIHSTVLQKERDHLQNKLAEMKAQTADKEVQITRLRKTRNELRQDIEGLNIALQAKQQENSYLKRCSSLGTSTRTTSTQNTIRGTSSNMVKGAFNSNERTIGSVQQTNHTNLTNSGIEKTDMLSSMTSVSKRQTVTKLPSSSNQEITVSIRGQKMKPSGVTQLDQTSQLHEKYQVTTAPTDQVPYNQQVNPITRVRRTPSFILANTSNNYDQSKLNSIRTNSLRRTSSYNKSSNTLSNSTTHQS